MNRMMARKPVGKLRYAVVSITAGTYINTTGWTLLTASMSQSACAIEVLNTTGKVLKLSTGAAGQEDSSELPAFILPSAEPKIIPYDGLKKGQPLSIRAVDANAVDDSQVIINFYG